MDTKELVATNLENVVTQGTKLVTTLNHKDKGKQMAGPLVETDLESINLNLERLLAADEQIKLAAQAGLDVTAFQEQSRAQRQQLLKIKQTYFPGE